MKYKKQPYCCAECCYSRFLKFPKPLCIITNKAFTHNTAKSKAEWCPIKDGKTIDDFRKGMPQQKSGCKMGAWHEAI